MRLVDRGFRGTTKAGRIYVTNGIVADTENGSDLLLQSIITSIWKRCHAMRHRTIQVGTGNGPLRANGK